MIGALWEFIRLEVGHFICKLSAHRGQPSVWVGLWICTRCGDIL